MGVVSREGICPVLEEGEFKGQQDGILHAQGTARARPRAQAMTGVMRAKGRRECVWEGAPNRQERSRSWKEIPN